MIRAAIAIIAVFSALFFAYWLGVTSDRPQLLPAHPMERGVAFRLRQIRGHE